MAIKVIASVAYRSKLGPTGGPGGVLYVQEKLMGNSLNDCELLYLFGPPGKKIAVPKPWWARKPFWMRVLERILGIPYVIFDPILWGIRLGLKRNHSFVCHEPITAIGLALVGARYALIYHGQGAPSHELNRRQSANPRFKLFLRIADRLPFTKAQQVYFPSEGAKQHFLETASSDLRPYLAKSKVAFNTILHSDNTAPLSQNISDFIGDSLTVLSVGALTKEKGIDRIVQCLKASLLKYGSSFKWVLVGSGDLKQSILSEIAENNLAQNILLIDSLPHTEILGLMKRADAYVMMHRLSIFDFATLEAMASKTAVVLTEVGGNKEFNLDGNILYIRDGDSLPQQLFEPNSLEKLKLHNLKIYRSYFSNTAFKEKYQSILQELM